MYRPYAALPRGPRSTWLDPPNPRLRPSPFALTECVHRTGQGWGGRAKRAEDGGGFTCNGGGEGGTTVQGRKTALALLAQPFALAVGALRVVGDAQEEVVALVLLVDGRNRGGRRGQDAVDVQVQPCARSSTHAQRRNDATTQGRAQGRAYVRLGPRGLTARQNATDLRRCSGQCACAARPRASRPSSRPARRGSPPSCLSPSCSAGSSAAQSAPGWETATRCAPPVACGPLFF